MNAFCYLLIDVGYFPYYTINTAVFAWLAVVAFDTVQTAAIAGARSDIAPSPCRGRGSSAGILDQRVHSPSKTHNVIAAFLCRFC